MTKLFHICALAGVAALAEAQQVTPPASGPSAASSEAMSKTTFTLVIHGGAGTIDRASMTAEKEKAFRAGLEKALRTGYDILKSGGSSIDTVEATVRVMEDDPHFNAGRGAVFTSAGTNELDSAIMDGKTLKAGAVANVKHVKNPISLARLIMEKSKYLMLAGEGAEAFAKDYGVELVDQKYFFTQERWDALQKIKASGQKGDGDGKHQFIFDNERHGTVGAVALDQSGNLAAATSTGGMTNKRPGRIGDSPIIGAGTYANNATCAVSATGDGEYFIRASVAHEISALIQYRNMSLEEAAQTALQGAEKLGGGGGLIAVSAKGEIAMPFNTSGMYRGYVGSDGKITVAIYK